MFYFRIAYHRICSSLHFDMTVKKDFDSQKFMDRVLMRFSKSIPSFANFVREGVGVIWLSMAKRSLEESVASTRQVQYMMYNQYTYRLIVPYRLTCEYSGQASAHYFVQAIL